MFRIFARALGALCLVLSVQGFAPVSAQETTPTCETPTGVWHNEMGSVLVIESVDAETGQIAGAYRSASGAGASSFPLIGWVNDAAVAEGSKCADCKQDHAQVFAFTVHWGEIGSITSWTGTCALVDDRPVLKTVWNLARLNTSYSWDHINSGSATFTPSPSSGR